jgi:hypothetical protein
MLTGKKKLIKDVALGSLYTAVSVAAAIGLICSANNHFKNKKQTVNDFDQVTNTLHAIVEEEAVPYSGESSILANLSESVQSLSVNYGHVDVNRIRLESLSEQLGIMNELHTPDSSQEQVYVITSLNGIEGDILKIKDDVKHNATQGAWFLSLVYFGLAGGFGYSSFRRFRSAYGGRERRHIERVIETALVNGTEPRNV